MWEILHGYLWHVATWMHHTTAVSTHICIYHKNPVLQFSILHDINYINLKPSCFICQKKTLHVWRTMWTPTVHAVRRSFGLVVSYGTFRRLRRSQRPRRHAIHAFDLNIEDHLGTTEVATGNQCHSSSGVGRFCVCVFFRNDLNLKPRDPRPKLKLAKTWKKHGKKRNLFHDFLQGGMLLFCFGGVVIVERIGSHVLFIAVIVLGDWCRAAESKERWVG